MPSQRPWATSADTARSESEREHSSDSSADTGYDPDSEDEISPTQKGEDNEVVVGP